MDILANDMSIHGQFDKWSFGAAFGRLMKMRGAARRAGHEIQCHRALLAVEVKPGVPMQQALQQWLTPNELRAAMSWMTRSGPFWEDFRRHGGNDYLEWGGEVVTDSAVGEAAFRVLHDVECGLVSVTPSAWECSPVDVEWKRDGGIGNRRAVLKNWYDAETMENELPAAAVESWRDVERASAARFVSLTFSDDCFEHLAGIPFNRSSADRVLALLGILNRLALSYDSDGKRTAEGDHIYQEHFTGQGSFSDSSETEKRKFRSELTFPHPNKDGTYLFCPWHGKESHLTLRLHFSQFRKPVYVVYVGPKLTKR